MQGWEAVCRGVLGITLLENEKVAWFLGFWFLGFKDYWFLGSKHFKNPLVCFEDVGSILPNYHFMFLIDII